MRPNWSKHWPNSSKVVLANCTKTARNRPRRNSLHRRVSGEKVARRVSEDEADTIRFGEIVVLLNRRHASGNHWREKSALIVRAVARLPVEGTVAGHPR